MQTGEPAQPVQFSLMTARMSGFFLRGVVVPEDLGSILIRSTGSAVAMRRLWHSPKRRFNSVLSVESEEFSCPPWLGFAYFAQEEAYCLAGCGRNGNNRWGAYKADKSFLCNRARKIRTFFCKTKPNQQYCDIGSEPGNRANRERAPRLVSAEKKVMRFRNAFAYCQLEIPSCAAVALDGAGQGSVVFSRRGSARPRSRYSVHRPRRAIVIRREGTRDPAGDRSRGLSAIRFIRRCWSGWESGSSRTSTWRR